MHVSEFTIYSGTDVYEATTPFEELSGRFQKTLKRISKRN